MWIFRPFSDLKWFSHWLHLKWMVRLLGWKGWVEVELQMGRRGMDCILWCNTAYFGEVQTCYCLLGWCKGWVELSYKWGGGMWEGRWAPAKEGKPNKNEQVCFKLNLWDLPIKSRVKRVIQRDPPPFAYYPPEPLVLGVVSCPQPDPMSSKVTQDSSITSLNILILYFCDLIWR